jgi:sulfite reductase (ferredoxin)
LLGGFVGDEQIHFGQKALRLPARTAPEAVARVVRRFAEERRAAETFAQWLERVGGPKVVAEALRDLDSFPSPDLGPEFYTDFDETGPFVSAVGESECAT